MLASSFPVLSLSLRVCVLCFIVVVSFFFHRCDVAPTWNKFLMDLHKDALGFATYEGALHKKDSTSKEFF